MHGVDRSSRARVVRFRPRRDAGAPADTGPQSPPTARELAGISPADPTQGSGNLSPASARSARDPRPGLRHPPLGQRLVAAGALDPGDLTKALALQGRQDARIGEILLAHRMVTPEALDAALTRQWRAPRADLEGDPPPAELIERLGAARCLSLGAVPWKMAGWITLVASSRPEQFAAQRRALEARLGPVALALATTEEIERTVACLGRRELSHLAETAVPEELSCRGWRVDRAARWAVFGLALLLVTAILAPKTVLGLLTFWVALTLFATMFLKGAALAIGLTRLWRKPERPDPAAPTPLRLPVISMMVPLHREEDVAQRLVTRLCRLRYPSELTDILLLTEEDDETTAAALAKATLPDNFRVLTVPPGTVQTKPRALNYGLPFCRGQIVGIWDAEDAPDPGQLHAVVETFTRARPDVACLQGVLDFYNTRRNWLSRCFALEYAIWFRAILPGLQAMRLPLPLGGTTLFFRRPVLEALAGWDAHNVTEDADLGLRLARAGYRTEMVPTVTQEEANCRALPWIRQRSRWLKGYAMTWSVHMRAPRRLWRELGLRGFLGMNVLFLGTLSQFVLAPVTLSFLLLPLGFAHPLAPMLGPMTGLALIALFLLGEAISFGLAALATAAPERRFLLKWAPTLPFYFPLAILAAYKGLWEILTRPFWWDKTHHGLEEEDRDVPALETGGAVTGGPRLAASSPAPLTDPPGKPPKALAHETTIPAVASARSPLRLNILRLARYRS